MNSFDYVNKTKVLFGSGRFSETAGIVKRYGDKCLLVSEDAAGVLKNLYEEAKQNMKASNIDFFHFDKVKSNPTTDIINEGTAFAKLHEINVVLGIGGGSSMDTAKAIALGVKNEGDIWDYRVIEGNLFKNNGVTTILVTTTSGTGSHVTNGSVVTNTKESFKSAVCKPEFFPVVSIIDPILMKTLPPVVTAYTGFDALTHLFEGYINVNTNDFIELLAFDGMKRIIKNLKRAIDNGNDIEAREQLAWADTLGGYCIVNCGVVLPHGIAMAISGRYPNISHGEALALVFPECVKFTYESCEKKYAELAYLLNDKNRILSEKDAAKKSYDEIKNFLKEMGLELKLKDYGVSEKSIEEITEYTFKLPDYKANPLVPDKEDIRKILIDSF